MITRPPGPGAWGPDPGWYTDSPALGGHNYWDGHRWLSDPRDEEGRGPGDAPQLHLLEPHGVCSTYTMSNPRLRHDVVARRHDLDRLTWTPSGFFSPQAVELALRFGVPCGRGMVVDDFVHLLSQHPQRATGRTQSSAVVLERSQADLVQPVCPGWLDRRRVFTTWTPSSQPKLVPLHAEDLLLVDPVEAFVEHWRTRREPDGPTST